MRYVVRQKIFSLGDNFIIRDEAGKECFRVLGKVFSVGDKLRIYNMANEELVYIEQQVFRLLPEYRIYYNGQLFATVKKEFTFFKPKFQIQSTFAQYRVEGDIWGMNFNILKSGKRIGQVSKKWFSWSDTYGVDINDNEDQPFILALVIVIDEVIHDGDSNNS